MDTPIVLEPWEFEGVVLVGAGPGDPDLITVAGLRALGAAELVVTDRLVPHRLLSALDPAVEVIDVAKVPRHRSTPQERINRLLIEGAQAGKRVVRLKGGDSFVFGRGFEELAALTAAGIAVRVIPGVSSPIAAPELAGIPVTHRGLVQDFTVVSGHVPPGHPTSVINWSAVAQLTGTLVLMMAVDNAGAIAAELIGRGRSADQPVAVVADGSLSTQVRINTTLAGLEASIASHTVRPPAVIVIGEVATLRAPTPA